MTLEQYEEHVEQQSSNNNNNNNTPIIPVSTVVQTLAAFDNTAVPQELTSMPELASALTVAISCSFWNCTFV
jgi:hypothetical protein